MLVPECLIVVPERLGRTKWNNIMDAIRLFFTNLAILAISLARNGLNPPLHLVVGRSTAEFSLGDSSISKKGILGTGAS